VIKLVRALAAALCLIPVSVAAAPAAPREATAKAIYVVQLEGAPLARSAAVSASSEGPRKLALDSVESLRAQERLRLRQDEAIAAIGGALGREPMPLHRYTVAFNGLALELTEAEAEALARVPGVRRVQLSARYHLSSDAGPAWTGAPGIWNGTATGGLPGTQGEGMIIGIIDTGVTFGHPSFADVGGDAYNHVNPRGAGNYAGWCSPSNPDYDPSLACNDKLIGAWSHEYAGDDPRDDNGHGTHTSSIAAGNHQWVTLPGTSLTRLISGVAPHANLIAYDACESDGYCDSWVLTAAVDQAVADGVDVINMSVTSYSDSPWHDSLALALLEARDAGIFVAAALRNSYDIGLPGNAPWVLAVGASTHDRRFSSSLVGVSGGSPPLPNLTGQGWTNSYGPASIVRGGDFGDYDCSAPFPPGTFGGRIVVCNHYYYDSVVEKGQNVLAGGAGGLILIDDFGYDLQGSTSNVLPWVYLPYYSGGSTLWSWLATGSGHTAQIVGTTANINAANGDRLWPDSASGGDFYYVPGILKPDVVAPGQDILAAYPITGVEVLSGASMAAAHASGAAALLLDLHPTWTPAEIQSALQTTGVTVTRADGTPANALDMGSGRLSLGPAARAGLVLPVTTAQYEAVDPWDDGDPKELNLASLLDEECSVSCGWTRTVRSTLSTTSTWNATVEAPAGVTLTVTPSSFTLGPGGTQSLQITASGSTSLSDWKFGRIVLTESGAQAPPARLPVATFWVYHHQLTVAKSGSGTGVVTSNPAGINCGSTCSAPFPEYTYVTLTATPSPGSVFVGWSGYCDGPQPTCTVSMYYSQTVTAYFNPPSQDKALTNQVPLKDSIKGPVYNGTWNYYSIDLGSGNGELVVDLLDLTADASLHVRHGDKPTYNQANCVDDYSYDSNNRRCVILSPSAGRWWIGVSNQEENVLIRYTVRAAWGNASDRELANRSPHSDFLSSPSSGTAWKYYFVDLAAGGTGLTVDLTHLSADADLYVRHGAKPDRSNNDCASSEGSTLPDRCTVSTPAAGRWWIGVNNFSAGTITYRLAASWQTVDTAADLYIFSPCRVLDTRSPSQPLISGVPRTIQIAGLCGIPSTAKAVVANVTITGATGLGNLTLYPGDEGTPATSTHNFGPDQTRANNVLLKLDSGGAGNLGALATVAGVGQVHVIVDVSGYYE
jgi:subtilisin family serine protease